MSRHKCCDRVAKLRGFVLRQSNSMSRHNGLGYEDFMSRLSIFMSRQNWSKQEKIM